MTLAELAKKHGTDKFEHGYCPHYEEHFKALLSPTLLEIGIATGASMRMWADYFLPEATIMGIDNNPDVMSIEEKGFKIFFGDATDETRLRSVDRADIIIDDGSHMARDIIVSYDILWPRVNSGGWYVIEDLGAAFTTKFGGDSKGGQVIELVQRLLNNSLRAGGVSEFHAYEEIVFLRKR